MAKYIIGEIFSSRGATLYKNPSDQTVAAAAAFSPILLLLLRVLSNKQYDQFALNISCFVGITPHSMIRGVVIQSCSAGAKNFTKYVFFHAQFNGLVKNSQNHCAIKAKFLEFDFY